MAVSTNNAQPRKSILIVTEAPEDVDALQDPLLAAGYDLVRTYGTEEALRSVETRLPVLVLLDVTGPEDDGAEFCRRFRTHSEMQAIPVIAVTEDSSLEQQDRAIDIGADGVICRPFQPAELLSRVRSIVRMQDLHDRVAEQNRQLLEVNAQLDQLNQELTTRNRELEQGMAMAHRLQEALLPQHYPRVNNISFSHAYEPADAIGGDIFQIDGLDDGRAAILIVDVSGHGVRAALITSIVKTVADYIDMNEKTPSEILTDFNSRFRGVLGPLTPQIYATAVLLMVDGEERVVSAAAAGHPSPFHISKQQMTANPLMTLDDVGPALGFIPDPEYPTIEVPLGVGDIVLGFTDGIYEVLNEREEMFGIQRLEELVAANAHLIPRDLIQRLITETEEFIGSSQRPDDVCMVAFEVY